jgi:hypothetical protein
MKTDNKNIIIIVGIAFAVIIVAVVIYLMTKEKGLLKSGQVSNETMDALISNYDDILDNNTKQAVWLHVLKTCPKWKGMVVDQVAIHGGDLESRFLIEADWNINKNYQPSDWMKTCNDEWKAKAGSIAKAECKKINRQNQWIGLLTGALWLRKKKNC